MSKCSILAKCAMEDIHTMGKSQKWLQGFQFNQGYGISKIYPKCVLDIGLSKSGFIFWISYFVIDMKMLNCFFKRYNCCQVTKCRGYNRQVFKVFKNLTRSKCPPYLLIVFLLVSFDLLVSSFLACPTHWINLISCMHN